MDKLNELLDEIRSEFKIPSSISNEDIINSLDDMIYRNEIELEIALDDFKKEARVAHKKARYIYPSVPKPQMW